MQRADSFIIQHPSETKQAMFSFRHTYYLLDEAYYFDDKDLDKDAGVVFAEGAHKHAQGYRDCKRKLSELHSLDYDVLSKTRKFYIREHISKNKYSVQDHRIGHEWCIERFWEQCHSGALLRFQALVRGMLTRRKIHFALLSADPDALARTT